MSRFWSKEEKLLSLMERTGYNIIQENGQRTFGPPPDWPDRCSPPAKGCEVFVGKIPRDCYEDELVPIFEKIGTIYQLRLMMDFSGTNRGYAFVTFTNQNDAKKAIKEINGFEIRPNKRIGVVKSADNCRLFIGGIPLNKSRNDVIEELSKVTEGVVNAIVYPNNKLVTNPYDKQIKNRGFAFVEYSSHRAAAMARRKLLPGKLHLWGSEITVDWAIPEPNLDDETMSKVTVLFVRYLSPDATEDLIKEIFSLKEPYNVNIQRVKRMKNYAFVHFYTREDAELVLKMISKTDVSKTGLSESGQQLEVTWAKPPNAVNYRYHQKKKLSNFNNSNNSYNDMSNSVRNSPSIMMSGLRHSRNNSTPVWYSIENQYPWLPFGLIRSPQSIGVFHSPQSIGIIRSPQSFDVFRSPEPYNVFQ